MNRFTLNPHTADVRLELEASSLEELFTAGLLGMAEFIKPDACTGDNLGAPFETSVSTLRVTPDSSGRAPLQNKQELKKEIVITSTDITVLLIDFMSEVLTETQINKAIFCTITFSELTETSVRATIFGKHVESFDEDVKAITYHEADVKKNASGNYETTIVFDI